MYEKNQLIEGMSFDEYLADPAEVPSLTSSDAKAILTTAPREVWENNRRLNRNWEPGSSADRFELGTVFHEHVMRTGDPYVVVRAPDWRTKAAKEAREDAVARGKTPILEKHFETVLEMERAFADQAEDILLSPELNLRQAIRESVKEATVIWDDAGAVCRCRPDLYHEATNTIIHLKTTAVDMSPESVGKYAANMDWHLTLAHYDAGLSAVAGAPPRQIFAIVKTSSPYLAFATEFGNATLAIGRKDRALALERWSKCLASGNWPGFPASVVVTDVPEWKENRVLEREVLDAEAKAAGRDLLARSIFWQAPEGWTAPDSLKRALGRSLGAGEVVE